MNGVSISTVFQPKETELFCEKVSMVQVCSVSLRCFNGDKKSCLNGFENNMCERCFSGLSAVKKIAISR